ncbi:hypothetical protein D8863_08745 [Streptococcus oralis]|uniref:LXG domain-containing protein n=1 Tax=Streptococcus oralis TaxID=1303 RepID=A0A3R9PNG5_STROR|nr:hypothetical protein [Streptococcus oralis]RSI65684.1 hypothetical protein D8863_08745 [Streptococcus oralis]
MNTTKDNISDLVSYEGSSHTSTVMDYNFLMNQLKNLDTSITQYESNHASQDLVAFKELLAATKALIAEHASKTRTVGTYQSGDFAKLKSVKRFAIAYKQATQQMESRVERVKAAQERDKVRFEALAAEDRAKNGWKELGLGVLTFAIGFIAIIGTMGTATPLVVAGGIVGFGTSVYGLSNAAEGVHNIELGNAGDIHTKSKNPIRDTLFMGNDKLYHDVGNVFVTASAIMIPIGQTQSVVKGLTQFAIGEAGAYTAGQVAYHGTKLLGGSEEDAQTANFIGNIVGGYVTSSAASKFSLNKVKDPQAKSTTSPIKNMPLEEYEMYRTKSVINPDSDTMTLGKYEPTIRPDGTPDWSTPGPNSYISKAGDTTYFSLGDDWNKITVEYGLDAEGKELFKYFNKPALDDAVAQGKTIRFSHNPKLEEYKKSALRWEWDYLHEQYGYPEPVKIGEFWYAIK